MPNYKNGKIYKIVSLNTDKIYIGSTCRKQIKERLAEHKYNFKKRRDNSCSSFIILNFGDYKIELIEEYSCNNIKELEDREYFYINTLKNVVNKTKDIWDRQKYQNNNRKKINKQNKDWIENNQDKHKKNIEQRKKWVNSWGGDYRSVNNMLQIKI